MDLFETLSLLNRLSFHSCVQSCGIHERYFRVISLLNCDLNGADLILVGAIILLFYHDYDILDI